ncbi:hypothetical protein [Variovorax sp. PCZ-1]|uniref:hypothetical protein n=1 Tax=Variovorax sp. PCZ-1 TaxID=2835533 RepID=UPI001BCF1943|nr:hypothetical protein [Variovorax sp. PCZ-1]MBS7806778.1 hypothetical protein [Variovorax sp. PCZ-1]
MFSQLLLPLQGVVDFFSPPVPSPSFSSAVIGAQPRLAKSPAFPSIARPASQQQKIQAAGIRMVGKDLMGTMATGGLTAAQILRSRRAQDGRIVISGRMRDVCAELDRLCDEPA